MTTTTAPTTTRRRHPGQGMVLAGSLVVLVGSFLPWLHIAVGATLNGLSGAGLWTFYLGSLGVAGGLVPSRTAGAVQGLVVGGGAVILPALQLWTVFDRALVGWQPGVGLVTTFAGGALVLRGVARLVRG